MRDLYAGYGETEILHGVNARVEEKEIVAVIGPNGAGKSTLIKAIIGILRPSRGSIRFRDEEIAGRNPEELVPEGLAYIPQNRNIFPSLTVLENLEMGAITRRPGWLHMGGELLRGYLRLRGTRSGGPLARLLHRKPGRGGDGGESHADERWIIAEEDFWKRVDHITELFPNLRPKLKQRAGALSGGEQQMVALAKALVLDPTMLLIDEPSAGLAPKLVSMIFDKIREINDHGTAILLVEQNARKALAMSHRGYVLEMGRNRFEGKGEALLHDPDVGRLYLGG